MSLEGVQIDSIDRARGYVLDVEDIRAILPHRYPMLLVDRILELEPGKRAVGLKNITINEPFFAGHFPGQAIMPGVLIVEAMAQVAALMMLTLPDLEDKVAYIGALDRIKMRRLIVPGDTLITETTALRRRGTFGKARMVGRVNGEVAAEGEMVFALRDWREPAHTKAKLNAIHAAVTAESAKTGGHSGA